MDDLFKFLMIAGVLLISIYKEIRKENKAKQKARRRPAPPMDEPDDDTDDAWNKPTVPSPTFSIKQRMKELSAQSQPSAAPKKNKKKREKNKRDEDRTEETTLTDLAEKKEDFGIHSTDEARRAIIWGEILQRKY